MSTIPLMILTCLLLIFIFIYIKNKSLISGILFQIITGIGSLMCVHLIGSSLGFIIPISIFSIFFSAVMGVPGTILLSVLQFMI